MTKEQREAAAEQIQELQEKIDMHDELTEEISRVDVALSCTQSYIESGLYMYAGINSRFIHLSYGDVSDKARLEVTLDRECAKLAVEMLNKIKSGLQKRLDEL